MVRSNRACNQDSPFVSNANGDDRIVARKRLSEQVVVVTGASSGLGRAIARGAGERGAKVVVTARNAEALDNAVREIEAFGSEALAVPADHAVQDEVGQVVEQALDRFGRIDTYVANAIVTVMSEVEQLQPDELRRALDVNFFGMVYGFWAALPHLKESRGTFVHVSSALAYRGIPLQAAYCASKAAGRTFLETRVSNCRSTASPSPSPSSCRARSTHRSSTVRVSASATGRSPCRRSISRSRSQRLCCTAASTRCGSSPWAGVRRSFSGGRSSRLVPAT